MGLGRNLILLLILAFFGTILCSCSKGNRIGQVPVKSRKLHIEDKEYLKYTKYVGGEKVDLVYFVARVDQANHNLIQYMDMQKIGTGDKMPFYYTNFHYILKVNTENGYLEEAYFDYHDVPEFGIKLPEFIDTKIDQEKNIATVVMKIKRDETVNTVRSTVKLKPGYPVWDMAGFMFLGTRCMDISNKGILYIVEPFYIKDPVPCTLNELGKEVIETKAGKFNTIKIGFIVTDPFLGSLISAYSQNFFVWVEDAPRSLIIKSQMNDNINLLDEISVWK